MTARATKIVATIGPASRDPETLVAMIEAGMDVARLNFSHGTVEEHAETASRVRAAAERAGRPVAILQDLPGPKLRLGRLRGDMAELGVGHRVTLVCGDAGFVGDADRLGISWAGLPAAVGPGEAIYLADGSVRLRVGAVRVGEQEIDGTVEVGGVVHSRQGVNVPGEVGALAAVPAEDLEHLRTGEAIGVDVVALSFVRTPDDVDGVRSRTTLPLIAKIEKPQAVERAAAIVEAADGVMVARGDLGIELAIEEVPVVQKRLLELAGQLARPSITATQMLDSMVSASRPTRAEVADVANAILDGTDAVMLSQETAVGAYPVQAVAMMAAVAVHTENILPHERWIESRVRRDTADAGYTVSRAACLAARDLRLDALLVPTQSGRSAAIVAAHRPDVPVIALSPRDETVARAGLLWGVRAAKIAQIDNTEQMVLECGRRVKELGWCTAGQRVGITAGLPNGGPGSPSLVQVQEL